MIAQLLTASLLIQATQDPINNLVLATGTKTVELGKVGKSLKIGTGPIDVIVLPGAPFSGEWWRPFMERNGKEFTFHALSPAGYGDSAPPKMPSDDIASPVWTNGFLTGVESYVRENELDRPILLAHHLMSDFYAVKLAERNPDSYRGIFVVFGQLRFTVANQQNGQAAKLTIEERISTLKERWVPFYKTVTQAAWKQGTFPPTAFSTDEEKAQALFQAQLAVPIPIQLRYFLEYGCFDISESIGALEVPIHALDKPFASWEAIYANAVKQAMAQLDTADEKEAREYVNKQIESQLGSVENAKAMIEAPIWQTALKGVANVTYTMPKSQTLFSFLDAPEEFDSLFKKFVQSLD